MRNRILLALATAILAVPLAVVGLSSQDAAAQGSSCPTFYMPGTGTVCQHGPNYYEVFGPDGSSMGFTHGTDNLDDKVMGLYICCLPPPPSVTPPTIPSEREPRCVDGDPGQPHIKVLYVRSFDDGATFANTDEQIRQMVRQSNAIVNQAGGVDGATSDLVVQCYQGEIKVTRVIIGQPVNLVDFGSLTMELRNMGYGRPEVKYWVYYDHVQPGCSCSGQGSWFNDQSASSTNMHNGQATTYAVTWAAGFTTMLHELGHNMGAVQNGAIHSTLAAHCWDKFDIMCYADGGPRGNNYTAAPVTCASAVWDCSKDDYFRVSPPAGSYLDTNWNIAHPRNNYNFVRGSTMDRLACSTEATFAGVPVVCAWKGGNPGATSITYRVDWGDGVVQTTTATELQHTYAASAAGDRRIHVSATDNTQPNASGAMPWFLTVHASPLDDVNDCVAGADDCPVDVDVWG